MTCRKLRSLSNSVKFSAAWPLLPAYNFSATMASTYIIYHLGAVASLKFLALIPAPVTGDVLQKLLDDPLYTGLHQLRVKGAEYQQFIDEFMQAAVSQYVTVIVVTATISTSASCWCYDGLAMQFWSLGEENVNSIVDVLWLMLTLKFHSVL